jgi:precorrin-2 dehydrogenase/sirohydrochlorin ferrochelatase
MPWVSTHVWPARLPYNRDMAYYPIFVEMASRPCLVVGGGAVAEAKVTGLLAAGARVTVVAPDLPSGLEELLRQGGLLHHAREYREADLEGCEACFVATDDGAINARVARDCRDRGVWVNAADDPANCDFILPSVVRQGDVVLAASTGGASPALARRLREELTAFLDSDYAPLAALLNDVRKELRARGVAVNPETWQEAIDPRFRALVAQRRIEEARARLLERLGVESAAGAREA